jgi:hypothetical protein
VSLDVSYQFNKSLLKSKLVVVSHRQAAVHALQVHEAASLHNSSYFVGAIGAAVEG